MKKKSIEIYLNNKWNCTEDYETRLKCKILFLTNTLCVSRIPILLNMQKFKRTVKSSGCTDENHDLSR